MLSTSQKRPPSWNTSPGVSGSSDAYCWTRSLPLGLCVSSSYFNDTACSYHARQNELDQIGLDRDEAKPAVEGPSTPVVRLDDDAKSAGALGYRVALGVGEQPVSDAAVLMTWSNEDLFGDDLLAGGDEQGDIAAHLALFVGDEDDVVRENVEDAAVVPARSAREDRVRQPEELGELALAEWGDLDDVRHGGRGEGPAVGPAPLRGPLRPT